MDVTIGQDQKAYKFGAPSVQVMFGPNKDSGFGAPFVDIMIGQDKKASEFRTSYVQVTQRPNKPADSEHPSWISGLAKIKTPLNSDPTHVGHA